MTQTVKRLNPLQIVSLLILFLGLWLAYNYFQEQSLLHAGKVNSEIIAQQIRDGDIAGVEARLIEFAGYKSREEATANAEAQETFRNLAYVRSVVEKGSEMSFVRGSLAAGRDYPQYRGVYRIPDGSNNDDLVVFVLSKPQDSWQLANIVLFATDPEAE